MFKKYMSALLLLVGLTNLAAFAERELKGLGGTICVKNVIGSVANNDLAVTLSIDECSGFTLKDFTVPVKRTDLTNTYTLIWDVTTIYTAVDQYFFDIEVRNLDCPLKHKSIITVTPGTDTIQLSTPATVTIPTLAVSGVAALVNSLFAVTPLNNNSFTIRVYFIIAAKSNPISVPKGHILTEYWLKDLLQDNNPGNLHSPFSIHFISAEKQSKKASHHRD